MVRNRRSRVERPGPRPLCVVAGLPPAWHKRATNLIEEVYPQTIVQGVASKDRDGPLYPIQLVEILVRGVTEFSVRRRTHGPQRPIAPASITLLYVPSADDEHLLRAFDFSVMPKALSILASRDADGRQLRHSFPAIEAALRDALASNADAKTALDTVRERLNRLSDREALLLPPTNFQTPEGRLREKFAQLRSERRSWTDRFDDLPLKELTQKDLPRIPAQKTERAFVDSRDLVFFVAHPTAFHGVVREVDEEADESAPYAELVSTLRSLYRFGAPLPSGFHHDVQRLDGRDFRDFEFECATGGPVLVSAPHANIYANDFVRAALKRPK